MNANTQQVVCEFPDRSRTKGNSDAGPVSWMTEHAPDTERNTTYKTREEQEHDERSDWIRSLASFAPPTASIAPGGGRTTVVSSTASRPSGTNLGAPPPTAPAPSSNSPRTSHFGKNRGTTAAIVSQEEEEEEHCRSFFGPAKQVR